MADGGQDHGESQDEASGRRSRRAPAAAKEADGRRGLAADMIYTVEDVPPWYLCVLLGLQHYLTCFSGTVAVPFLLAEAMCVGRDQKVVSQLIGTIFTTVGITTLVQTTVGVRLPLFQASALAFLIPAQAILGLERWTCPSQDQIYGNGSLPLDTAHVWQPRIREVSLEQPPPVRPSIFFAVHPDRRTRSDPGRHRGVQHGGGGHRSPGAPRRPPGLHRTADRHAHRLAHRPLRLRHGRRPGRLPLGLLGAVHPPHRAVRSVPADHLAAFPRLQQEARPEVEQASRLQDVSHHPGHRAGVAPVLRLHAGGPLAQRPARLRSPGPHRRPRGHHDLRPLVQGAVPLPVGAADGDIGGRAGHVQRHLGGHRGIHRRLLRLRSAGRGAAASGPRHQQRDLHGGRLLHRGRAAGHGERLHVLQPQHRRASHHQGWQPSRGSVRRRHHVAAGMRGEVHGPLRLLAGSHPGRDVLHALRSASSAFSAFCALSFVPRRGPDGGGGGGGGLNPDFSGMITAVGLSNLQLVDLNSSRNLFVLGFSLFFGLTLPAYLDAHPKCIRTGAEELDQILTVLLSTEMFVGGFLAFCLDNTIPGSREERGLTRWSAMTSSSSSSPTYDFPAGMALIRRVGCLARLPVSPTFKGWAFSREPPRDVGGDDDGGGGDEPGPGEAELPQQDHRPSIKV
ncbi:solute carrier family 23 member 1 isoform X1 [Stigmatopora nigra]